MENASRLDHLALACRDISKTVEFYKRYAEMEVIHDRHEHEARVTWIRHRRDRNGLILVLIQGSTIPKTPKGLVNHLGFHVANDHEVDLISKMADSENCLVEPAKNGGNILGYYCIVRDPDGNLLEFSYGQAKAPCDQ